MHISNLLRHPGLGLLLDMVSERSIAPGPVRSPPFLPTLTADAGLLKANAIRTPAILRAHMTHTSAEPTLGICGQPTTVSIPRSLNEPSTLAYAMHAAETSDAPLKSGAEGGAQYLELVMNDAECGYSPDEACPAITNLYAHTTICIEAPTSTSQIHEHAHPGKDATTPALVTVDTTAPVNSTTPADVKPAQPAYNWKVRSMQKKNLQTTRTKRTQEAQHLQLQKPRKEHHILPMSHHRRKTLKKQPHK